MHHSSLRLPPLLALLLAAPSLAAGLPPAISGLSFSPDGGKVLVSMDADGVPNAWALPVAGGAPVQLTRSAKDPVWTVGYFPRDERVLYRSGAAGDEDHLFVRELDGRSVELFPGKAGQFVGWIDGGAALLVEIGNGGSQSRDLYRIAADGYAQTLVNRNSSQLARLAVASPDGRYLAYRESTNDLIRNVRVRDLKTGKDRSLLVGEGFTVHLPLSFSPDSSTLLVLDDIDKEFKTRQFRALASWDMTTGASRGLLLKSWDVLDASYSPDGKRLAVIGGGDTRSAL